MDNYIVTPVRGDRVYKLLTTRHRPLNAGTIVWQSEVINPSTSAVVIEEMGDVAGVYVGSAEGCIYKLDFNTGAVLAKRCRGISGEMRGLAYADGLICFGADDRIYGFH